MSTKWLDSALKRNKQESPNGKSNGAPAADDWPPATPVASELHRRSDDPPAFVEPQGDLQSTEDIYRAAGIMNPRMGYSIRKVVEMLNSEHLKGMANETKRAAVLMALDAAGVTVDEVLRDARIRQNSLDAYEASQRRHFEEHWNRKAEANAQIQAELDRFTAHSLERMKRNHDEIAHEKAAFADWQKMKQRESERMTDAVSCCSKIPADEPVETATPGALVALRGMGSAAKPS